MKVESEELKEHFSRNSNCWRFGLLGTGIQIVEQFRHPSIWIMRVCIMAVLPCFVNSLLLPIPFFFFLCFPFLSRPFKFVSGGLNLLKLDSYSYTFNTRILACACIEQFSSLRFERKCALLKRSKRSRCSTVVFFIPFPFLRFLPLNVERFTTDEKIIGENNRGVETVNYVN